MPKEQVQLHPCHAQKEQANLHPCHAQKEQANLHPCHAQGASEACECPGISHLEGSLNTIAKIIGTRNISHVLQ